MRYIELICAGCLTPLSVYVVVYKEVRKHYCLNCLRKRNEHNKNWRKMVLDRAEVLKYIFDERG